MLERQKRLNFLPEMQSKVTINCDNSENTTKKMQALTGVKSACDTEPTCLDCTAQTHAHTLSWANDYVGHRHRSEMCESDLSYA